MQLGKNLELGSLHSLKQAALRTIRDCVQGTGNGGSIGGLGMFETPSSDYVNDELARHLRSR